MRKIKSAPLASKIAGSDGNMDGTWQRWMRDASSFLESATKSNNPSTSTAGGDVVAVLIGKICFVHYSHSQSETTKIVFGYDSEYDRMITVYIGDESTRIKLSAGKNYISVPGSGDVVIDDWYIASLSD